MRANVAKNTNVFCWEGDWIRLRARMVIFSRDEIPIFNIDLVSICRVRSTKQRVEFRRYARMPIFLDYESKVCMYTWI